MRFTTRWLSKTRIKLSSRSLCVSVTRRALDYDEGQERIREAYPSATLARLTEVKRTYDPYNMFRFNQNIIPAVRG